MSTLERRHYEVVAKAVAATLGQYDDDLLILREFAEQLNKLCPNMNIDKFNKAAGLEK